MSEKQRNSTFVLPLSTNSRCFLRQWKVSKGDKIRRGTVLCKFTAEESEKMEELRSPFVGVVKHIGAREGQRVEKGLPVIVVEEKCLHSIVVHRLCADCGKDLSQLKQNSETFASVQMVHGMPSIKLSKEEATDLALRDKQHLLQHRKLALIVDLDQTMVHTSMNPTIPIGLPDVHEFELPDHPHVYHCRLRPKAREFLEKVSSLYELHIFTMGTRSYAEAVATILDPKRKYFCKRVISRENCDPQSKSLSLRSIFPEGTEMVAIIDDREDVWERCSNLIHVKPYVFFADVGDINAPPKPTSRPPHPREDIREANHAIPCKIRKLSDNDVSEQRGQQDVHTSVPVCVADDREGKILTESNNIQSITLDDSSSSVGKPTPPNSDDKDNLEEMDVGCDNESRVPTSDTGEPDPNAIPSGILSQEETGKGKEEETGKGKEEEKEEEEKEDSSSESSDSSPSSSGSSSSESSGEEEEEPSSKSEPSNSKENHSQKEELEEKAETTQVSVELPIAPSSKLDSHGNSTQNEAIGDISERESDIPTKTGKEMERKHLEEEKKKIKDTDVFLVSLMDILTRIHQLFYEEQALCLANPAYGGPKPDLQQIIPAVRTSVLKGVRIVFTGVIPNDQPVERNREWNTARAFGAEIHSDIVHGQDSWEVSIRHRATTHLVVGRPGTAKLKEAIKLTGLYIVEVKWLWECAEQWRRLPESDFPVKGITYDSFPKSSKPPPTKEVPPPKPRPSLGIPIPPPQSAGKEDLPQSPSSIVSISFEEWEKMSAEVDDELSAAEVEEGDTDMDTSLNKSSDSSDDGSEDELAKLLDK